jgi:hypothetical protein
MLVGIGKHRFQLLTSYGAREHAVFVAIAGQVLLIGAARGIGIQRRLVGAAMERAFHRERLIVRPA